MSRANRDDRLRAQRALGGERNAIRTEQLRAVGRTDRAIARQLGLSVGAVAHWFELQDELVRTDDVDGAA